MNVTTTYENLGPVIKELRELNTDEFFQFPGEGAVHLIVRKLPEGILCISLDDLQSFIQDSATVVEPREVNQIEIKVELL